MLKPHDIVVSFDLDFTLIDNREGIINSFLYALNNHDEPKISSDWIESNIGRPLNEMFSDVSEQDPLKLSASFREYYSRKGMYELSLINGVREKLVELNDTGFFQGVVTSKKEEIAQALVESLDMNSLFYYVLGETKDRPLGKRDPNLKQILLRKFPNHRFVVVGDHPSDRSLAKLMECPFIGVLTGHHTAEQLRSDSDVKILILQGVAEMTPKKIISLFEY